MGSPSRINTVNSYMYETLELKELLSLYKLTMSNFPRLSTREETINVVTVQARRER